MKIKLKDFREIILNKFNENFDLVERYLSKFEKNYWGKKRKTDVEVELSRIDYLFSLFIEFFPYLYRSLKMENKTMSLRKNLLSSNSENIIFLSEEEKSMRDLKEYYKQSPNILAKLEVDKEELRKLVYYIFEDKECKFDFPLGTSFDNFKDSVLLEILIEDKELMVTYLKSLSGDSEQDSISTKFNKEKLDLFVQSTLETLKVFFMNEENNEYFINNIGNTFVSRNIFLLVLDGNKELHEKYFVDTISSKNEYFDYSTYIREVNLRKKLEENDEDNRITKRKI